MGRSWLLPASCSGKKARIMSRSQSICTLQTVISDLSYTFILSLQLNRLTVNCKPLNHKKKGLVAPILEHLKFYHTTPLLCKIQWELRTHMKRTTEVVDPFYLFFFIKKLIYVQFIISNAITVLFTTDLQMFNSMTNLKGHKASPFSPFSHQQICSLH